jgi:hypothetical protein
LPEHQLAFDDSCTVQPDADRTTLAVCVAATAPPPPPHVDEYGPRLSNTTSSCPASSPEADVDSRMVSFVDGEQIS